MTEEKNPEKTVAVDTEKGLLTTGLFALTGLVSFFFLHERKVKMKADTNKIIFSLLQINMN